MNVVLELHRLLLEVGNGISGPLSQILIDLAHSNLEVWRRNPSVMTEFALMLLRLLDALKSAQLNEGIARKYWLLNGLLVYISHKDDIHPPEMVSVAPTTGPDFLVAGGNPLDEN